MFVILALMAYCFGPTAKLTVFYYIFLSEPARRSATGSIF